MPRVTGSEVKQCREGTLRVFLASSNLSVLASVDSGGMQWLFNPQKKKKVLRKEKAFFNPSCSIKTMQT